MADFESYQRARNFRAEGADAARSASLGGSEGSPDGRSPVPTPASDRSYILDFYCAAAKLAIEIDGQSHLDEDRSAHDARRTAWLGGKGIRVVRIAAIDVRDPLDGVVAFIAKVVAERLNSVSPPPSRR